MQHYAGCCQSLCSPSTTAAPRCWEPKARRTRYICDMIQHDMILYSTWYDVKCRHKLPLYIYIYTKVHYNITKCNKCNAKYIEQYYICLYWSDITHTHTHIEDMIFTFKDELLYWVLV
jgi:hypothetical protein